jgi:type I restriction enzyme S subunit
MRGYLQELAQMRAALVRCATGISVYGLTKANLLAIELFLPPVEEQLAIVRVLIDLDDEIEALEGQLAKTQDLKTAMAQELLSGRTRLV